MDKARLETRFTYHPATGMKPGLFGAVRAKCLELALMIDELLPDGEEKYKAVDELELAMFYANAGISRNKEAE